jgi:hypothetical protein
MVGFLDLPGEIRNLIYDHLLVFEKPAIVPWAKEEALPVNLLYVTNKTIHHEFGSLFYSQITFDFSSHGSACEEHQCRACSTKRIVSFLDRIGQNAKYIQSIKTDFPFLCCETKGFWTDSWISEYSVQIVNKIGSNCSDLRELILSPTITLNVLFDVAVRDLDETLDLLHRIDRHLRKIPSLESIVTRLPDCDEYYNLKDDMEFVFGWEVELIDPLDIGWITDDDDDDDDYDDDNEGNDYEAWITDTVMRTVMKTMRPMKPTRRSEEAWRQVQCRHRLPS